MQHSVLQAAHRVSPTAGRLGDPGLHTAARAFPVRQPNTYVTVPLLAQQKDGVGSRNASTKQLFTAPKGLPSDFVSLHRCIFVCCEQRHLRAGINVHPESIRLPSS